MARGVNKVILIGHLGQDPETRYFPEGGCVTNVSLATTEQWKDKQTGEPKEATEWHRLSFRNKLAEIAGEYLKKGSLVYVEGKNRTRKWTDQNQIERYTTEVVVQSMQMLDKAPTGATMQQAQQEAARQPQPAQNQTAPGYAAGGPPPMDFDDDIPFNRIGPEAF